MINYSIGACEDLLPSIESNSIDCIVTDPPYGLKFMGLDWDKALPSEDALKECCRVLKPGAFGVFMCTPRQDLLSRMVIRLDEAGFKTGFTSIYWVTAQGFPKAMNISKMVDKRAGAEREIIGKGVYAGKGRVQNNHSVSFGISETSYVTAPATPEAEYLNGSYAGFQPKPATEIIIVVMKPLSEKTYVDQALKNGKGVTWSGDCKIPYTSDKDKESARFGAQMDIKGGNLKNPNGVLAKNVLSSENGRFPANVLCCDDILNNGINTKSTGGVPNLEPSKANVYGWAKCDTLHKSGAHYNDSGSFSRYFDLDAWFTEKIKQLP